MAAVPFSDLTMCKVYLKSLTASSPDPIPLSQYPSDFKSLTGKILDPKLFGYSDLESFLRSLPNVVQVVGSGPRALVKPIITAENAAIRQLIDRQKTRKKKVKPVTINVGRLGRYSSSSRDYSKVTSQRSYHTGPTARSSIPNTTQRNNNYVAPPRLSLNSTTQQVRSNISYNVTNQQVRQNDSYHWYANQEVKQNASYNWNSNQEVKQNVSYTENSVHKIRASASEGYHAVQKSSRFSVKVESHRNNGWGADSYSIDKLTVSAFNEIKPLMSVELSPGNSKNSWETGLEDVDESPMIDSPSPLVKSKVVVPEYSSHPKPPPPSPSPSLKPQPVTHRSLSNEAPELKLSNGALNTVRRSLASAQSHNDRTTTTTRRDKPIHVNTLPTNIPSSKTRTFDAIIRDSPVRIGSEELLTVISSSLLSGPLPEKLLYQKLAIQFYKYAHSTFLLCCIQMTAYYPDAFVVKRDQHKDENDLFSIRNLSQEPEILEFDPIILEAKHKMRQLTGVLVGVYKTYLVAQFISNEEIVPALKNLNQLLNQTVKTTFLSLYRENEICAVQLENGPSLIVGDKVEKMIWYRAQLLNCEMDGFYRRCRLYLLDFGVEVYINQSILRPLPSEFRSKYRVHLVDIDGVIVDASSELFEKKISPYLGQEIKVRPSECMQSILNVAVSEIQLGHKLLSDMLVDQKICRRGREWARDFVFPHQSRLPVVILSFNLIPVVPVRINLPDNMTALKTLQSLLYEQARVPVIKLNSLSVNDICVWKSDGAGYRVRITSLKENYADITFLDAYDYRQVHLNELFMMPRIEATTLPYQVVYLTLYLLKYPPRSNNLSVFLSAPYEACNIDGQYILQNEHTQAYLNIELLNISLTELKKPELSVPADFFGVADVKTLCYKLTDLDSRIETRITMACYLINQLIKNHSNSPELDAVTPHKPPKDHEVLFCRIEPELNDNSIIKDLILLNDVCDRVMVIGDKLCCLDRALPLFDIPEDYDGLYRTPVTTSFEKDPELNFLLACAKSLPPLIERGLIINSVDMEALNQSKAGNINFISKSENGKLPHIEVAIGDNAKCHFASMTPPSSTDVDFIQIDVINSMSDLSLGYNAEVQVET